MTLSNSYLQVAWVYMIDVSIPQQQQGNWLGDLNLVAELSACHGLILTRNGSGQLRLLLQSMAATHEDIASILGQLNAHHGFKLQQTATPHSKPRISFRRSSLMN